jgi:hypothetical protein
MSYITTGSVTAVLSMLAILAGAFGKSHLQAVLQDPTTVQTVLTVAGAIGTLVAGLLPGIKS